MMKFLDWLVFTTILNLQVYFRVKALEPEMSNLASKLGHIGHNVLKLIFKSPRFVSFGSIWPKLDAKFDITAADSLCVSLQQTWPISHL